MKIRDRLPLLAVLCCFSALLLLPEVSAQAAQDAMLLCAQTLIPSLFPFFVLSSLLIACGASELLSALLSLLMRPLFGLSGAGAAALALESGRHPGRLKDEVCSPAGSTIAGVHALERAGLRGAAMDAVAAAFARTREMGKQ